MGDSRTEGDGRLELDDLGGIIDRSTSLDAPPSHQAEVLEGVEGPSFAERLETAGVAPWVRRHRVVLASVTAVVVLAATGLTAVVWTRPAPEDTVMAAVVVDSQPSGTMPVPSSGGIMSFDYTLTPERPSDRFRVLGMEGPGIRASSAASPGGTNTSTGAIVSTVSVVPECDDPAVTKPAVDSYRLKVERTNALGHVLDGVVAVPSSTSAQWPNQVLAACLQQWLRERVTTESVTVTSDPSTFSFLIDTRLHNDMTSDLIANLFAQGSSIHCQQQSLVIAKMDSTRLPLRFVVDDCTRALWEFGQDAFTGQQTDGMSLYVSYTDSAISDRFGQGVVGVKWDRATQRKLISTIAAICAGVPAVTAKVVSSRQAVDPAFEANGASRGLEPTIMLRSTLEVRTSATHVRLSDTLSPEDVANGTPPMVRTAADDVHNGRAVITMDWLTSCTNQSNPPPVQLALSSGGRVWPARITVDSNVLANAYKAACPGLSDLDLQNLQWNVSSPLTTGVATDS